MTAELPEFVTRKVLRLTLEAAPIAYLVADKDGRLTALGGDLGAFDLERLEVGRPVAEQVPLLEGLLPLEQDDFVLRAVDLGGGRYADIHLSPDRENDWIILLDRSQALRWRLMAQQKANELSLLRQQMAHPDTYASEPGAADLGAMVNHCHALNMLPLEPMSDGSFRLLAPPPSSFRAVFPEVFEARVGLRPDLRFPFIENFLIDAAEVWGQEHGRRKSGPWIEADASGKEYALEATAASWMGHELLFIEMLDDSYEEELGLLQVGREHALARQLLEKANRTKSEFLSYMSHELRTPLNVILGYGQLLGMEEDLRPELQSGVREILSAGRQLLELINELLDLARIESGRIHLSIRPVSCGEVLGECVSSMEPVASRRSVRIQYDESQARGVTVLGDFGRLKQVLLNLLSNAIKYNREGGSVDIRVESSAACPVRMLVTDTGPGISPDRKTELFQPFSRLGVRDDDVEGTGIGLTISKQLTEMMKGRIGVESEPGKGSTFWIELPQAKEDRP